jgi:hypothetical protein
LDASSLVLIAISSGELGDGGVLERVVAELLFIDHRRVGSFLCPVSDKFKADAFPSSVPSAALSEPTRLRKLDMVRLKLDVEPKERLGGCAAGGSWSAADEAAGAGVEGGAARGVRWGLREAFGGGAADELTSDPSRWPSEFGKVWKSCDWRPLTGVTGSITASLSVSSPSSRMGCVSSVGYCRGDDERLDLLEVGSHAVSNGVRNDGSTAGLLVVERGEGGGGRPSWFKSRSVKIPNEEACVAAAARTETAICANKRSDGGSKQGRQASNKSLGPSEQGWYVSARRPLGRNQHEGPLCGR